MWSGWAWPGLRAGGREGRGPGLRGGAARGGAELEVSGARAAPGHNRLSSTVPGTQRSLTAAVQLGSEDRGPGWQQGAGGMWGRVEGCEPGL